MGNKQKCPNFSCKSFNKLTICACIDTSRNEIGSSHIINFGFKANPSKIPPLFCPLENS